MALEMKGNIDIRKDLSAYLWHRDGKLESVELEYRSNLGVEVILTLPAREARKLAEFLKPVVE